MVSIVIPVIDQHETTYECVHALYTKTYDLPEIIIIDNNSDVPYEPYLQEKVIRNEKNLGMIKSLQQGVEAASNEIVVHIHNDVLIHEKNWDHKVKEAFNRIEGLAIAGFFGASGVHPNGGRSGSQSQMLGKVWGAGILKNTLDGEVLTGIAPASVLDGLCIIFKRSVALKIGFPVCPPHHWYDRLLPLWYIERGYRCATIGVAFDHRGGITSSAAGYNSFAEEWCKENGIVPEPGNSWDHEIYLAGARQFVKEYAHRLPLFVDDTWSYTWKS